MRKALVAFAAKKPVMAKAALPADAGAEPAAPASAVVLAYKPVAKRSERVHAASAARTTAQSPLPR